MKMKKRSQALLLVGLLIGLLGLWSSAAPVGLSGDLITAGSPPWSITMPDWGDHPGRGNQVGCTGTGCGIHYGNAATTWLYCPDGPVNLGSWRCTGGAFVGGKVVVSGATLHATATVNICSGVGSPAFETCYYHLSDAAVY
jgi:hypothetical protein